MTKGKYAFFLTMHTLGEIRKADMPMRLLCHILKVGPEEYFTDPALSDLMLEPYVGWEDLNEEDRIDAQKASAFAVWLYALHQKGKNPKDTTVNEPKAYLTEGIRKLRREGKITNSLSKAILLVSKSTCLEDMKAPMAILITALKANNLKCDYASLAAEICRHVWERDPDQEIRFVARTY